MEDTKHTPGPWIHSKQDIGKYTIHSNTSPHPICITSPWESKKAFSDEQNEANAKLIAAAPEMLEFIQNMNTISKLRENGAQYDDVMIIKWTDELIKKATT